MYLASLSLQNFRNYRKQVFKFSENTSLFVGDNAVGKTNILEAIYLLASGGSFRATREQQMILYGQELGRVVGMAGEDELEIVLTIGEVQGERVQRKRYLINGVAKRKMDFVGRLRCVLFRPEDIELVLGSPSIRREYMDSVLEQVDREYRRSNLSYQKGLRQRNKLLERIREGEAERKQLLFWNRLLIKNGEIVVEKRREWMEFVNQELKEKQLELGLEYDKSVISEARLSKYSDAEIAAAKTLVGPHRDDFMFIAQRKGKLKKDLGIYGSRGEQRMAVLAVKLAELEFVKLRTESKPVLLLDDIFSELDHERRNEVLGLLEKQQTVVTTTDEHLIPSKYKKKVEMVRLR
jgi:DNA replication and repair protein RecF